MTHRVVILVLSRKCILTHFGLIEPLIEEETQRAVEGITDEEIRSEESSCGISASILSSRSYAPPLLFSSTLAATSIALTFFCWLPLLLLKRLPLTDVLIFLGDHILCLQICVISW